MSFSFYLRCQYRSLTPPLLDELSYIPIKIDYTDLFDVLAFFSGDLDGQNHHEQLAKQIADNGKDYTERFWRYADMEACESPPRLSLSRVVMEELIKWCF